MRGFLEEHRTHMGMDVSVPESINVSIRGVERRNTARILMSWSSIEELCKSWERVCVRNHPATLGYCPSTQQVGSYQFEFERLKFPVNNSIPFSQTRFIWLISYPCPLWWSITYFYNGICYHDCFQFSAREILSHAVLRCSSSLLSFSRDR